MTISVQSAGAGSLARSNPSGVIYVKGDQFTDGSLRLCFGSIGDVVAVQERENGVWNAAELELGQSTLLLGRGVKVSASGHHMVTSTDTRPGQLLVLGQTLDDSGSGPPLSTVSGLRQNRVIVQPDFSVEKTLTVHTIRLIATGLSLGIRAYLKTGSVAASADVRVLLTEGVSPNDIPFFDRDYPASDFLANSEPIIDLSPGVDFAAGAQVNGYITSPIPFSMLCDTTGVFPWLAADIQPQFNEHILTESLVLSNDLGIAFSNTGDMARRNFVFS